MLNCAVLGAGGFIGGHLVARLLEDGHNVVCADIKPRDDWWQWHDMAENHPKMDLRDSEDCEDACYDADYIYQLAADMGGAGYVFTGENDAQIMHNSAMVNLNVARAADFESDRVKLLYTSSACVYPQENQTDPDNPNCAEDSAYPANPDSPYGFEKLFSENLYASYARNRGLDVRIARLHNVAGPNGSWNDDREKAPAAACRKVAEVEDGGTITIWGDGEQTRSFMHVDDCVEGMLRLMESDHREPINLGRDEMVTITELFAETAATAGKSLKFEYDTTKPQGVRGRNSDNKKIIEVLGWEPSITLRDLLTDTYPWIAEQVKNSR